jgi:hypothetical protein
VEENNLLNECQFGFRKGYSTIDAVYALCGLAQMQINRNKKMYAIFVDLSAAFDMIDRSILLNKLNKQGFSIKIIKLIADLYKETEMKIWDGKNVSRSFIVNKGVRQGCILSPLLFALYMNDLADKLRGGVGFGPEGHKRKIGLIMYADDIVICAESPDMIKMMLNELIEFLEDCKLKMNMEKTHIMIFGKKGGRAQQVEKIFIKKKEVKRVTSFKYLGVIIKQDLTFDLHVEDRSAQAKKALNASWTKLINNDLVPEEVKIRIYKSAVESIVLYGAELWGYNSHKSAEKVQI